jgi:hypothetical protein
MHHQLLLRQSIKEDKMGRISSTHAEDEKYIENLIRKSQGKKPIGRPRHR